MEQEQRTDQAWNSLNGGKYSDAAAFFEDAMRWSEANYGLENEDTLHLRDNLGKCLQELENFKEAKDLSQETLRARERLQGSDNPDTIKTRHALAVNLSRLGRYKDSIELHRLNMLYQEKSASQNYLGMLETRQCLESDLYSIGEPQEALMLDEGTQRLRELVRDITLANQNDPNQGDPMAIVAGADGWAMLCPEEMEAWRKKLTKWAEEREKLLRTNQEEGKTRKEERPERMTEGGQKKKAGEGEKYKTRGATGASKQPGRQKQNKEDISKAQTNQRPKSDSVNDAKKSPQINIEPPKEGAPKINTKSRLSCEEVERSSTTERNRRSNDSEIGRLSPGARRPRAKSASIEDRILAGFKHVSSPQTGGSALPSPTKIPWDGSQLKIFEGVRHLNSPNFKNNTPRPSTSGSVAGEKKWLNGSKPDINNLNDSDRGRDGRNKNPGLGRSSSVPPAQKYHQHAPPLFDVQRESGNKSLQRLADGWFLNLERYTERLVASYRKSPYDKVRIAILDTGIEKSSRATTPDEIRSHGNRIKAGKSFVANEPAWNQDSNGHGTHAAGLLLRVARGADIYIARILRGNEKTINTENVVEALKCCIDEWNVDIISMSFGYEKEQPEIEKQLKRADNHNILVFAAASNDGASKPINIAWPARATNVMCVNSATGEGNNSGFNPPMDPKKWNFAMLGEEVNSTWPLQLIKEAEREENGGTKRKSGTSFATPIAAATAALVLEFARQPPLSNNPKVAEYLKKFSGMQEVFMLMSERKEGKFYYVYPWKLLNSTFGKGTSRGIGRADHNDANDRYSARGMVESSILNMVAKNVQIF